MSTGTMSIARLPRLGLVIALLAALAVATAYMVRPAYAGEVEQLQESQRGTDSSEAQDNCEDGDEVPAGQVLWHFILNGLDPGITSPISGHFEFASSGTLNVDSSKWNAGGTTHHFFVFTTGDDVLIDATADIGDSTYNSFVLSHICHGEEVEQSVAESEEESVPESAEESVPESAEESVPESAEESVPESEEESVPESAEQSVEEGGGEQSVKAGEGTPAGSVTNAALGDSGSNPLPTIAFSLILLASLGALAYANVKSVRNIG